MSDLLERLRTVEGKTTKWYRNPDGPEAADEIERLRAELSETTGYWEECQVEHHKRNLECQRLQDSINTVGENCGEQLRAERDEIERLRDRIADAETVIQRGVELMTVDQLGQWAGVRTWLEGF
jgi:hypothetical protein